MAVPNLRGFENLGGLGERGKAPLSSFYVLLKAV